MCACARASACVGAHEIAGIHALDETEPEPCTAVARAAEFDLLCVLFAPNPLLVGISAK